MVDLLSRVEIYLNGGLFDKAIQTCLDKLNENPQDWDAKVLLGRSYFEKGVLTEAREECEEVAKGIL